MLKNTEGLDDLHIVEVKPPAQPSWASALVVRDADGSYWAHDGEDRWICVDATDTCHGEGSTTADVDCWSPITVVIDGDGRNVKADRYVEYIEGWKREEGLVVRQRDRARDLLSKTQAELDRSIASARSWRQIATERLAKLEATKAKAEVQNNHIIDVRADRFWAGQGSES